MFCPECGTIIPSVSKFCFKCGKEIKIDVAVLSDTENTDTKEEVTTKDSKTVPSTGFQTLIATFSIISPVFMIISVKDTGIGLYELIIIGCMFVAGIIIFLTYKRIDKDTRTFGAILAVLLYATGGWFSASIPGLRGWLWAFLIFTLYYVGISHEGIHADKK